MSRNTRIALCVFLVLAFIGGAAPIVDHLLTHNDRVHYAKQKNDLLSVYDQILRYEYEHLEAPEKLSDLVPEYLRSEELYRDKEALYDYDRDKRTIAVAGECRIGGLFPRALPSPSLQLPKVSEHLRQQGIEFASEKAFVPHGPQGKEPPQGSLIFEAEHYTDMNYAWEVHPDPTCSGGAYAFSKEGIGNGPGQIHSRVFNFYDIHEGTDYNYIRWHFHLDKPGNYFISGRVMTTGSHCSNNIVVGIDRAGPRRQGRRGYYGSSIHNTTPFSWVWTTAQRVYIPAGDHFLEAYLHEDGVKVDQFALSPLPMTGDTIYRPNFPINQDTKSSRQDGPPVRLNFDLKSMVITPKLKPECNISVRRLRAATGKALIRVKLESAGPDGKDLQLSEYALDLPMKEELIFLPVDFSKLDFSKLKRREYLLVAELIQNKKTTSSINVPLCYPFAWQVCGPFELFKNGEPGPLDGDKEPKGDDPKTGKWSPFKDECYDHFAVLDFGLQSIGNSLHAPENVTMYAKTEINVPETGEYLLKIQADDQLVLWIDGKEVYSHDQRGPVTRSVKRLKHHLEKGPHKVRIRVNQWHHTSFGDGRWQASLRFRTADDALSDVTGE